MKRVGFILLALLFIQQLHAQHFMAGLSGSGLVSDVQGTDTRDFDNDFYKAGFSLGAFVNRQISDKNILQLEINYIQKGAEQVPDSNNNGYFKLTLNYIEVPVLLRHRIHFNANNKFYNNFEWELGVSGGYLFSYNFISGTGYSYTYSTGSLNTIDISVLGGINYILSPSVYVGLRYSNSLIPVMKRNNLPSTFNQYSLAFNDGNNLVWAFSLKYVIAGKQEVSKE